MVAHERSRQFDPDDPGSIWASVLQYPFLQWTPSAGKYPVIDVLQADGNAQQLEVQGIIGSGGFGVVFLCEVETRLLAVKIPQMHKAAGTDITDISFLFSDVPGNDSRSVDLTFEQKLMEHRRSLIARYQTTGMGCVLEAFRRETSMLTRLRHRNIVGLEFAGEICIEDSRINYGTERESPQMLRIPCIAMQYVRGQSLRDLIGAEKTWHLKQDFRQVLEWARDLALAVACIHDRQTCHRDLSWNNVLMDDQQRPVIIDLGNVALPGDTGERDASMVTADGVTVSMVPFTPGFLAPEHRNGTQAIDGLGDQFSLGVLLYLLCSGAKAGVCSWPFDPQTGKSLNPENQREAIPLGTLRQNYLRNWTKPSRQAFLLFSDVVRRMLEWHPDERFRTMRDVAAALELICRGVSGQTQHSVPATELTPDAAFDRWCTQHGMQAVPSAAVLLLQLLVTQARSQIQASIARTWDSLYETRTDGQLSDTEKVRELEKHGVGMETEFKSGTNVIVRTFLRLSEPQSGRTGFGQHLRRILGKTTMQPLPSGRMAELRAADTSRSSPVDELWNFYDLRQEQLAEADFQLAVYSLELQRLQGNG